MTIFDLAHLVFAWAAIVTAVRAIRSRREAQRLRDPHRRDVPYRGAIFGSPPASTLRPFGSKCHACGREPRGAPIYDRSRDAVYRTCTRQRPWNDIFDGGGCGADWYEMPKGDSVDGVKP